MDFFNVIQEFFSINSFPLLILLVLFLLGYYKKEIYPLIERNYKETKKLNEFLENMNDNCSNTFNDLIDKKMKELSDSVIEIIKSQENLLDDVAKNNEDIKEINNQMLIFIEKMNVVLELLRMLTVDKQMEEMFEKKQNMYLSRLNDKENINEDRRKFNR